VTVGVVTGAGQGMGQACAVRLLDMVDSLLLVDNNEGRLSQAAQELTSLGKEATIEPFPLDITDGEGLARLASRVKELGVLRAAAHVAGVSPTMADWRRVLEVDLVGSARLTESLWPLATAGTSIVCFASMAPLFVPGDVDPAIDAVLDDPLDHQFFDRIHDAVGPAIEDPGLAYMWAKRGVHRLVRREAVRFGRVGARVCSVSPGIIDTPMGRQEAAAQPFMELLVQQTPLGREGLPDEVAAVAAFLLSDDAGFVNGIDVLVDGGVLAAVGNNRMSSE
jgi:NAD(P)-dependent dehydrogenase (short-subunit alcohol dehydrogenase family)